MINNSIFHTLNVAELRTIVVPLFKNTLVVTKYITNKSRYVSLNSSKSVANHTENIAECYQQKFKIFGDCMSLPKQKSAK